MIAFRRHALRVLQALAAALCVALAQPATAQALQPLTFTAGVGTVPSTALVELVTREQGLWQKQGLQPTTPPPLGGGDRRSWNAEEENHSDVRLYGLGAAINYMSKGVDFVVVADLGLHAEWHMWSLSEQPLKASDIRGKRIAVTQMSGTDKLYAELFLKALGVAASEVEFVPTGGLPQNYQALRNRQADIWVTTEHAAALIDKESRLSSVVKLSNFLGRDWDPYVILAKRSTLQRDPALVQRAVAALLEGTRDAAQANPEQNRQRLMQRFNVDAPTAQRLLATVSFENPSGRTRVPTIEKMRRHYIEQGIIKSDAIPLGRIYDESVVR